MAQLGVLGLSALLVMSTFNTADAAVGRRGFTSGSGILSLNGTENSANLKESGGGDIEAPVVSFSTGSTSPVQKTIGSYSISDLDFGFSTGFSKSLSNLLQTFIQGQQATSTNYSVLNCDLNQKLVEELKYQDGLITQFIFPALDATSKEQAIFGLKFSAQQVQTMKASGGNCPVTTGKEKPAQASTFKIDIPGIDTSGVISVSPIVFDQKLALASTGGSRTVIKVPGKFEIGNFEITVAENKAADFQKWFTDFVINGIAGSSDEKTVTISLLDPSLKKTFISLTLNQVGIFKAAKSDRNSAGQSISTVTYSFYAETAQIK
ncbi:MAG: hypothetical protein JNL01_06490 [Bdellovibrionales bacterium]|nr:hypothetical protein [Bdellovibrionales bacterium]